MILMADYNISRNYLLYKGSEQREKIDISDKAVKDREAL